MVSIFSISLALVLIVLSISLYEIFYTVILYSEIIGVHPSLGVLYIVTGKIWYIPVHTSTGMVWVRDMVWDTRIDTIF